MTGRSVCAGGPGALRGSSLGVALVLAGCVIPRGMATVEAPSGCRVLPSGEASIAWYGPTEAHDAEQVQAWCETVAAPLLGLGPSAFAPGWTPGDTLTVMSWNMNIGGGDLLALLRDELGWDCAAAGPASTSDFSPFVLLLQETYRRAPELEPVEPGPRVPRLIDPDPRPGADLDIGQAARRCGLAHLYVPSARNGPDPAGRIPEDKGNAILSSVPLEEPFAVELPFEAGRKVAVGAIVRAPYGEPVQVVSLHLDVASTLYRTLLTGNGTRLRQVSGLTDVLDARAPLATVVGGDFNTWSVHEGALSHMQSRFPAVPLDASGTRGGMPADHIFFRSPGDARVRVVPGSYRVLEDEHLSDHRARALRLALAGGT